MIESLWIMLLIALSCSLMGTVLVLKESVMIADAISHTALLGIVLMFFLIPDFNSPWVIVSAAAFGLVTILAVEGLIQTNRLRNDAAIGLIVPAFFSLAVILISKYFKNVHLDADMVLLGDIVFAPLNRMKILGHSLPKSLVQGSILLLVNVLFLVSHYRTLKIRLFDPTFAKTIGIRVALIDLLFMSLVSFTSVISFQSVGAILVISLMIAPALAAKRLAKSFFSMLVWSMAFAIINCCLGYWLSLQLNVSMAGMVSVISFFTFLVIFSGTMPFTQKKQ